MNMTIFEKVTKDKKTLAEFIFKQVIIALSSAVESDDSARSILVSMAANKDSFLKAYQEIMNFDAFEEFEMRMETKEIKREKSGWDRFHV